MVSTPASSPRATTASRVFSAGVQMARAACLAAVVVALAARTAQAELVVFLDYTDFNTRLSELASNAGVTAYDSTEQDAIRAAVQSNLESVYSPFDVQFTTTSPGGSFETISFGLTDANPGLLGQADSIDYRNRTLNQLARVFTANFGFVVDEFPGSTSRPTQISQLSAALAHTAAHELGHNLGLQHYDAYSNSTYTGGALVADGSQNNNIMGTGSTGASESTIELASALSQSSIHKLEFAAGLTTTPALTNEQLAAHGTAVAAQTVTLATLPVSGALGANVVAEIGVANEIDFYRFFAYANTLLSAYVQSSVGLEPDGFDATMRLLDIDGTTELAFNDDSRHNGNSFGDVTENGSQEPSLFNVLLPTSGYYFLEIAGFDDTQFGNYELLIATDISNAAIPEPSSWVMMLLAGVGGYLVHRRRRR